MDSKSPKNGKQKEAHGKALPCSKVGMAAMSAALGSLAFMMIHRSRRRRALPSGARESICEHQRKLAHFEELAAGLAHEVRNPLTSISALVFSIQRKLPIDSPEHKNLETIRKEIQRVNQILKEFTQLSHPTPPRMTRVNIRELLDEVCALLRPELERLSIALGCECEAGEEIQADRQQLTQVLWNLIKNAAESIGRDGRAWARVRRGDRADMVIIEVEDTGPGIPAEAKGRVFEPFFSTKPEGTGLGLAVSQRIIDRHGGRLGFESQTGGGTVFRIELPVYERHQGETTNSNYRR